MPELPEVETMVRDLLPRVIGRSITKVEASWPGEIVWPEAGEFEQRVTHRRIEHVWRRGKYAILELEGGDSLIIHRGMSGTLLHRTESDPMESHVRVLFRLDNGHELRLDDPRKFGKVFLMKSSGEERSLPWYNMGPEPTHPAFTPDILQERLRGRKAAIKTLLLNQQIVAGLGNIYVDETLHHARIHPEQRAHTLSRQQISRLHVAIRQILSEAIQRRGTTFSTYSDIEGRAGQYQDDLHVFRKAGAGCLTCGTTIVRFVVGGRGTHICPTCQKV